MFDIALSGLVTEKERRKEIYLQSPEGRTPATQGREGEAGDLKTPNRLLVVGGNLGRENFDPGKEKKRCERKTAAVQRRYSIVQCKKQNVSAEK